MLVGDLGCGLTDSRLVKIEWLWIEWDGQWTEGNKMKNDQRCVDWNAWDEIWTMKSIM